MSVALATGLVGRDRGPAQPEIVQAANITVNPTPVVSHRPQVVTVVILGSDAEANALRVTIHDYTRDDPDLVIDQKWTYIEVVETAEEETELRSMLDGTRADLAEDGIDLQVLDLR